MENLYFENENSYTTTIKAKEISNNITDILTKRIRDEIEGKCIKEGYIKKDSVRIISRSTGEIMNMQFNGSVIYHIMYISKICNPNENMILKCYVQNINKMGILAYIDDDNSPLNILLAKQHHQNNEFFNSLNVGNEIYVSILGKRFEFGDTKISIIGKLTDTPQLEYETKKEEDQPDIKVAEPDIIYYSNKLKTYKWLSNFNISEPFTYKGRKYISLEHAFNAQKNDDDDFKDLFTLDSKTYIGDLPNFAKKTGNKTNMKKMSKILKDNWDESKKEILEDIIKIYYDSNSELKEKLKKTGDNIIVYKGVGIDNFWGVDKDGNGENNHGKILMELRKGLGN